MWMIKQIKRINPIGTGCRQRLLFGQTPCAHCPNQIHQDIALGRFLISQSENASPSHVVCARFPLVTSDRDHIMYIIYYSGADTGFRKGRGEGGRPGNCSVLKRGPFACMRRFSPRYEVWGSTKRGGGVLTPRTIPPPPVSG